MATVNKLSTSLATFNVRGLATQAKQAQLAQDLGTYKVDIMCLQETKVSEQMDSRIDNTRLILIPGQCRHYGLGFALNAEWGQRLINYEPLGDRICVARFDIGREQRLIVINVYAPTQARATANASETDAFYERLAAAVQSNASTNNTLVIAGDFNAKIGQWEELRDAATESLGKYSRGRRNKNGQRLVEFCEENGLVVTNSLFRHRASHRTTWVGERRDEPTGETQPIYNQIDYVLVQKHLQKWVTNSRPYAGTTTTSDHRLVVMHINLPDQRPKKQARRKPTQTFDTRALMLDDIGTNYHDALSAQLAASQPIAPTTDENNNIIEPTSKSAHTASAKGTASRHHQRRSSNYHRHHAQSIGPL